MLATYHLTTDSNILISYLLVSFCNITIAEPVQQFTNRTKDNRQSTSSSWLLIAGRHKFLCFQLPSILKKLCS